MNLEKCLQHIADLGDDREFSIRFLKRTDNKVREMRCRTHLARVPGGNMHYSFKDHKLIPVIDCNVEERRVIPIEGITQIKIGNKWEKVTQPPLRRVPDQVPEKSLFMLMAEYDLHQAEMGGETLAKYAAWLSKNHSKVQPSDAYLTLEQAPLEEASV